MRLICLNIWGARVHAPFFDFIKKKSRNTDIFCFQEVFDSSQSQLLRDGVMTNSYTMLQQTLADFTGFFAPIVNGSPDEVVDFDVQFGMAIFVKNHLSVQAHQQHILFQPGESVQPGVSRTVPRKMQSLLVKFGTQLMAIRNVHGIVWPIPKVDTPDRIRQSKIILETVAQHKGPQIVCGDFNLLPDTRSLAMLEQVLTNQVQTHKVSSTRSSLCEFNPKYPVVPGSYHSSYTLTSTDVVVQSFQLLPDEVSDHLAQQLDFAMAE